MIASYYDGLPIGRYSLMIANQPWSGYYQVSPPIWAVGRYIYLMINVYIEGWSTMSTLVGFEIIEF